MTMRNGVTLSEGVLVEKLGSECVVFVPGRKDVLTLSGDMARVVVSISAGKPVSMSDPGVSELVDLGVVSAPSALSRRGVLSVGAVGVGAGVAALAMPSVAAASSPSVLTDGGDSEGDLNGGGSSSAGPFAGFEYNDRGASQFAGDVQFGTITLDMVDAEGNVLGTTIAEADVASNPAPKIIFSDAREEELLYQGNNTFGNKVFPDDGFNNEGAWPVDGATGNYTFVFWKEAGHQLTFTYKGDPYVIDLPLKP